MVLIEQMQKKVRVALLATIVLGCSSNAELEYFCEGSYPLSKFTTDLHYVQTALKLNSAEVCFTWTGDQYSCAPIGGKRQGPWKSEDNGMIEKRYQYEGKRDGDNWIMIVSEEQRPTKKVSIEKKETQNGWTFQADGIPLGLSLPLQSATEENLKTFELYSVINIAYWNGRMVKQDDGLKWFGIGGISYPVWFARANNLPSYTYTFNQRKEILIQQSTDTSKLAERLQCEVWKKQKWWQL